MIEELAGVVCGSVQLKFMASFPPVRVTPELNVVDELVVLQVLAAVVQI